MSSAECSEGNAVPAQESGVSTLKNDATPSWLILGGVGFIGRNLAKEILDTGLGAVRVVDKSHWATSMMSAEHKALFATKKVEYKQADLAMDAHVQSIFDGRNIDYVINLVGETRFEMPEGDYETKCVVPVKKVTVACQKISGLKKFVEVSTAQVYEPGKKAALESSKVKPWTLLAKARLQAEEIVKNSGLPHVILRPATVYGPSDMTGLMPRLCCAAVYKKSAETMKFLWTGDLKMNVVHVADVCRAIIQSATSFSSGSIFNLADQTDLDQAKFNAILRELFAIKTDFIGSFFSNLAKLNFKSLCNDANSEHTPIWMSILEEQKIFNTPLSPFISHELLYDYPLFVDGTAVTKANFKYSVPYCNATTIREEVLYASTQGIYPSGMMAIDPSSEK